MKKTIICLVMLLSGCLNRLYAQLETEDALPLAPGQVELGGCREHQISKEGTETAQPLALE